jgi:hypothetical protein
MKHVKTGEGGYVCPKFYFVCCVKFHSNYISNKDMDGGPDMAKVTGAFMQLSLRICQK